MAEIEILNNIISTIDASTRKPEQFLSVQNEVALNIKNSIKCLYDFTKEQSRRNTNALPELVTEGFDEEQIWQQLELQNEGELVHFLTGVSKVLAGNKKLTLPISTTKPELVSHASENSEDEDKEEENMSDKESLDSDIEEKNKHKQKDNGKRRKKKASIVDDKFFKLQELDEYLTKEEKKEKQSTKEDRESDEESVDLFNDYSESDEDDPGEEKLVKYADFFDNPDSEDDRLDESKNSMCLKTESDGGSEDEDMLHSNDEDEMDIDNEEGYKPPGKKVTFNLTNDSDETDSLENKANMKEDTEVKSSLEMRQERLQTKIHKLEEEAVSEKPWQLKGEVSATNRPQNSLLEEFVEFDITTRPAPVMTEQTTLKLEDIIKQRIKDKAWDDVEKKFKPVETPLEYKKKLILDQEKSKESLSQIYENEYLKQKQAINPESNEKEEEEPKLHTEIRQMMHTVMAKLDALSNFHYTPKLAKPEIKIISNVPAISMEEVAPVATTDATLLAPEEVKPRPKGDVIGKSERTQTDMKRERRKKKLKQHLREQDREKKEKMQSVKPGIEKKYKKEQAAALMKKLRKDRNISQLDETSSKVTKSSTAFFNQLQDQVKSHIKSKAGTASKKKERNTIPAVKLKL